MTDIINGKDFADKLCADIKEKTDKFKTDKGITPGLAVILVGEDPASQVYVNNKSKRAKEVGFNSFQYKLDVNTSQNNLLELIHKLNDDKEVHGILVQLPLPKQIDTNSIINAIAPSKDVDGFSEINVGKLSIGNGGLVPCTPLGCSIMLKDYFNNDLSGKHAVIIGRSNIVGKPMANLLLSENCTVTIVHSKTKNIKEITQQADIIVAAIGKAMFVDKTWLKKDAVVIDVGINRIEVEGKKRLVGDVDFNSTINHVKAITPVPGGVGPMTIACLLQNTLIASTELVGK